MDLNLSLNLNSIILSIFILIVLVLVALSLVFKSVRDYELVNKIIGSSFLIVVALLANNIWIYGVIIFVIGLIVASEKFMILLSLIMRAPEKLKDGDVEVIMNALGKQDKLTKTRLGTKEIEENTEERERKIESSNNSEVEAIKEVAIDLNKQLEEKNILLYFEKVYKVLFAGQLEILRFLENLTSGETLEVLVYPFYAVKLKSNPWLTNYGYEKYIGFLQKMGFVSRSQNKILLTSLGKRFLSYISGQNYPSPIVG